MHSIGTVSTKIRIGKHSNSWQILSIYAVKPRPVLNNRKGLNPAPLLLISDKPRQRWGNGRLFDCLVVKSEIPNIFNLRVEYIRPTAVTRFTCCHLLPVGGKIWGSEADRGKAHTRAEQTRDRCAEKYWGIPNSHLCSLVHFIMTACASDDCPKTKTVNCLQVG